ncbi:UNVERIFIED_CONTAM: Bifunctional phosphatase IMPL2, chloroplastic [Sesamum latifolium]|uniref:Bifunctional phosphatase IMPL2, chloroplastic n=1 Tax=Sesamum latifolium TaxID=2727402 RepID=A0AAW2V053_9LAMI
MKRSLVLLLFLALLTNLSWREMDRNKWEENYLEWTGDLCTQVFASLKGLPVKVPLYGCDCYAYALLASGYVDLVVESGLKPYDFLSLIPVIEGAGGIITDWKGHQLCWEASSKAQAANFNVVAAGDKGVHQEALDTLQWARPA